MTTLPPGPALAGPREQASPCLPAPQGPTLGELSRCRTMLCRFLVMWVSRLRARFQGLQIQWLSSPLGAERSARLRAPRTAAAEGPKEGSQRRRQGWALVASSWPRPRELPPDEVPSSPAAGTQQALAMGQARPTGMAGWSGVGATGALLGVVSASGVHGGAYRLSRCWK